MRRLQWLRAASVMLFSLPCAVSGQTSTDSTTTTDSTASADSSVTPTPAPVPLVGNLRAVGGNLRFKSITVGGNHACGLTPEGKAYCWGKNNAGQLGDSTTTDRDEPVPVSAGVTFKSVSAGGLHTCGVADTNQPYCWGTNVDGQLGDGTRVAHHYPFLVAGELLMTAIYAGPKHTCGTIKHWDKEGQAMCWGLNHEGQLGNMSTETSSLPIAPFGVIRYVSMALGEAHSCGATREGRVFCWGANKRGELGNGSATESRVPFITRMNRKSDFTMVAAGSAHSCALSGTGDVICWGDNTAGQVGSGSKGARILSPAGIREAGSATAVYATGNATCALRNDGTFACWGSNTSGLFGSTDSQGSRTPAPAFVGANLKTISLGPGWGCGLQADGSAVCWGKPGPAAAN